MKPPPDLQDGGGGVPSPRKPNDAAVGDASPPPQIDESTGLPGLRSWRAVYTVVLGLFILWVGLLTWLTVFYS